jgi:hypothetical protein
MTVTLDLEETKYTRVEFERRFLISPQANWKSVVESYWKTFEDKYLRDTRLRLRVLTDSDTGRRVLKLNKKFESASPWFRKVSRILLSRPNTNSSMASREIASGRLATITTILAGCSRSTYLKASLTGSFFVRPKQMNLKS